MIEGNLRNVPLTDVFQIITTGMKSGILTLSRPDYRARIYFEMGLIQYAHLSPGVHLGEVLVRMERLSSFEVQTILLKQKRENAGTPLGLSAVAMGYITQEELKRALNSQITEVLTELIFWKKGSFHFAEKSNLASQIPTEHAFEAMPLLMQVIKNVNNWKKGHAKGGTIYERAGDPTNIQLPDGSWEILGYVDGKRNAFSIASELDMQQRQVMFILNELEQSQIIKPSKFKNKPQLVLAISPSSAYQRLINLSLLRSGYMPKLESAYISGLRFLESYNPHLIIVDDFEGQGWEFVKTVRKSPKRKHLPIIVLGEEHVRRGFFNRFKRPKANVLSKPFTEADFQQMVSNMTSKVLA